ncbi:hypothetical protein [Patulibacter minatonensis]|uniref:hypothetical protein n=1 Tax=Patulibacter minatonensis TaxID=298163 RepID=UPI00047D57EF|nr:hypothetical protein [Patulibacter minatonensis]
MSQERPISVELQIDEARPLSGRLRSDDGAWRGFAGWIGLAGAIDGVLDEHALPGDGSAPGSGPARDL